MADIDYSELEELTLNMEDENGVVTECELQFVFEYEDKDYGAFCEVDSDTGEFYLFVMNGKTNWKGEPELEDDEDDSVWDEFIHKKLEE